MRLRNHKRQKGLNPRLILSTLKVSDIAAVESSLIFSFIPMLLILFSIFLFFYFSIFLFF